MEIPIRSDFLFQVPTFEDYDRFLCELFDRQFHVLLTCAKAQNADSSKELPVGCTAAEHYLAAC